MPKKKKEEAVLKDFTGRLVTAISAEVPKVAVELFEKNFISETQLAEAQLPNKVNYVKASELVAQVRKQVKLNPEKFNIFLLILHDIPVLRSTATEIQDAYNHGEGSAANNGIERRIEKLEREMDVINEANRDNQQEFVRRLEQKETEVAAMRDELKAMHKSFHRVVAKVANRQFKNELSELERRLERRESDIQTLKDELASVQQSRDVPSQAIEPFPQSTTAPSEGSAASLESEVNVQLLTSRTNYSQGTSSGSSSGCCDDCIKCLEAFALALCIATVIAVVAISILVILVALTVLVIYLIPFFVLLGVSSSSSLSITTQNCLGGNSDVVFVSEFDSSVNNLDFSTSLPANISLYPVLCSDIETEMQNYSLARQLRITNNSRYEIDEVYFVEGSEILYTFSSSNSLSPDVSCLATIYVFGNYSAYFAFKNGSAIEAISSYCIPPSEPISSVNFNLSTIDADQYYFVGMAGFTSATVNYTVTGSILKYKLNLSSINCTLPTTDCSVSLDDYRDSDQDICILATLQGTDHFVELYSNRDSKERKSLEIAAWVMFPLAIIAWIASIVGFVYCCFCREGSSYDLS